MFWLKRYWQSENGISATEFALLAPFLILLIVGTFDIGAFIYQQQKVNNIASAGADYLSKGGDQSNFEENIISFYTENEDQYSYDIDYTCMCSDAHEFECSTRTCDKDDYKRRYVRVEIQTDFKAILPYPGLPDTMHLSALTRLRVN